jgi:predicted acylesterase/phospholipase RssA
MSMAFVLSGGGAKGDFEIGPGAVRYLFEKGYRPQIIIGASVGAINAVKLADGLEGLKGLEEIWLGLIQNTVPTPAALWSRTYCAHIDKTQLSNTVQSR